MAFDDGFVAMSLPVRAITCHLSGTTRKALTKSQLKVAWRNSHLLTRFIAVQAVFHTREIKPTTERASDGYQ